jgi:hypothetical protein
MSIAYQFVTYNATAGAREDVLDLITNVDPEETPFLSRLGVTQCYNRYTEWLQDTLESGTGTGGAVVEGAEAVVRALDARTRLHNWTQITDYTFGISGTQEATSQYGLESEYSYQLEKAMKILKIMQEQILLNSTSSTGGMGSVCATGGRSMTGLIDCLTTNVTTGSAGSCALTESMFNAHLNTIFEGGNGRPDVAFVNGFNKRRISAFATNNTRQIDMSSNTRLRNVVTGYMSDFGDIDIVLDRWIEKGTIPTLQMDKFKVSYLRKPFVKQLAVTGDSRNSQLLTEYTLQYLNESSSGKLSALATS